MLPRCAWSVLLCGLLFAPLAADEFPYVGIVNRDGAPARSGPGEEFYATDALREGDRVEVYRIDEGGWCAIRPPAGSFSLVLEHQLHLTDTPGLAEVAGDHVLAYVGSRIREKRDAVQVILNRGEVVEIVGSDEFSEGDSGRTERWYRIAPPAGEFRWVHLEFVDREDAPPPVPVEVAAVPERPDEAVRGGSPAGTRQNNAAGDGTAAPPSESIPPSAPLVRTAEWKPLPAGTLDKRAARAKRALLAAHGMAASRGPAAGRAETENRRGASDETAPGLLGPVETKPITAVAAASEPDQPTPPADVRPAATAEIVEAGADDVARLDVEFSLMVAKPVTQWRLDELMRRAEQMAEHGDTVETRDRARALLERMRQFHQLHHRPTPLGATLVPPAASGPPAAPGPAADRPSAGAYQLSNAARGPVVSNSGGGLPRLLSAIESLMPPPPSPRAGVPPRVSPRPPVEAAGGGSPTPPSRFATVSVQTPNTAPPDPATRAALPTEDPVGTGAWRSVQGGEGAQPVPPPTANAGSAGMLDQIKNTLLYPLGADSNRGLAAEPQTTQYDGQGYLVAIVSRHGHRPPGVEYMPPFGLADAEGNIRQFVTPAPGVNLHRYLKKEIGVFGQVHPLENLNRPHITASRVVMLDRHRR